MVFILTYAIICIIAILFVNMRYIDNDTGFIIIIHAFLLFSAVNRICSYIMMMYNEILKQIFLQKEIDKKEE